MIKPYFFGFLSLVFFACRQHASTFSSNNKTNNYETVLNIAAKKAEAGLEQDALKYIDSAYSKLSDVDDEAQMKKYIFLCNVYYNGLHDYNKTSLYADSMLMLVTASEDKTFTDTYSALANYSKGDAFFGTKNYNEAFKYYYTAKTIAGRNVDSCALNDYSYRLGMVLFKQQHYAAAAEYFKLSYEEANHCDRNFSSFYRRQELLNNAGISFANNGQQDSALVYYNATLKLLSANVDLTKDRPFFYDIARAVVYNYKAQLYTKQGKYELAEKLFKESININSRKGNDNRNAQEAQVSLANLYLTSKKTEAILPLLTALKKGLDTLQNDEVKLTWNELMWKYYKQVGNASLAFEYLNNYVASKDSLADKNKTMREMDVSAQLTSLEKEYQIDLLKKNNRYQQLYLIATILFGLMAVAIILLIFINAKRTKKSLRTLTILNDHIEKQKTELKHALSELKNQSQEKDKILRIVVHDLRVPIGGIVGLSSILIDENKLEDMQLHMANLIKTTAANALQLTNEILEVSAFNEIEILDKQPGNIDEILADTVQLLQFNAAEKNQKIIFEKSEKPKEVLINREKITRVISNLISNAIKFSPNNETINVTTQSFEDGVLIAIKDKGIGIPEHLKKTIFNVFTAAKRPGTVGEKSFGLGLSICRQIVQAHNGEIWFESEVGNGTTFFVHL